MHEKLKTHEARFLNLLVGKPLSHFDMFSFNDAHLEVEPEKAWLVDAGIEIGTPSGTLSFGWNSGMGFYDMIVGELDALVTHQDILSSEPLEMERFNGMIGKTISSASFKWNAFDEFNDEFEPTGDQYYVPFELVLEFEHGEKIQFSTILFEVRHQKITRAIYNSERGQMLVAFEHDLSIIEPEQ